MQSRLPSATTREDEHDDEDHKDATVSHAATANTSVLRG
jgi:hypothetical protein